MSGDGGLACAPRTAVFVVAIALTPFLFGCSSSITSGGAPTGQAVDVPPPPVGANANATAAPSPGGAAAQRSSSVDFHNMFRDTPQAGGAPADSLPYPKESLFSLFSSNGDTDQRAPNVPHPPSTYTPAGQPYTPPPASPPAAGSTPVQPPPPGSYAAGAVPTQAAPPGAPPTPPPASPPAADAANSYPYPKQSLFDIFTNKSGSQ